MSQSDLINMGVVTKTNLNQIKRQFIKRGFTVEEGLIVMHIFEPKNKALEKGDLVVSAAHLRGNQWHVRAKPGVLEVAK